MYNPRAFFNAITFSEQMLLREVKSLAANEADHRTAGMSAMDAAFEFGARAREAEQRHNARCVNLAEQFHINSMTVRQ
jgi:hypothetical protein